MDTAADQGRTGDPRTEPVAPPRRRDRTPAPSRTRPREDLGYPSGWFAVALTRDLTRQRVLRRRLMGQDIVLYRTRTGRAYAVDPYCPHLGAHLGVGGTVEGENLVCPFHRFAFAPDGTCAGGPDGAMIRGRLNHHHLAERNGIVFVWHGHDGAAPDFEPPHAAPAHVTATASWITTIDARLQDTVENILDVRHLAPVHGVGSTQASPAEANGPVLRMRMTRSTTPRWLPGRRRIHAEALIVLEGLGSAVSQTRLDGLGMTLYIWVLHTPIGPRRLLHHLLTGCQLDHPRLPVADQALTRALARMALPGVIRIARQDVPIWTHQHHLRHPHLAPGDEALGTYRRWARQFYPSPDQPAPPPK